MTAQTANGEDIAPTLWSDNYVELMPGESLSVSADLPEHLAGKPVIAVSGWNVPALTLRPLPH